MLDFDLRWAKLDLLWDEYEELVRLANEAEARGQKLRAIGLAIYAYKAKSRYDALINDLMFNP